MLVHNTDSLRRRGRSIPSFAIALLFLDGLHQFVELSNLLV